MERDAARDNIRRGGCRRIQRENRYIKIYLASYQNKRLAVGGEWEHDWIIEAEILKLEDKSQ